MKRLLLLFLLLSSFFGIAQYTSIPDPNFEQALIDLGIDSGFIDGKVLTTNVSNLKALEVPSKNISDLTGIEAFLKLEQLNIGILNNDPSQRNKITNLNITNNVFLKSLNCSNAELSNLDLSKNKSLEVLYLDYNKFTNIDISKNTFLTSFFCQNNNLTSLDVTHNTALSTLVCDVNHISNLDVSKNLALTTLRCYENELSNLDISKNSKLKNLNCGFNTISNLDVSTKINLQYLSCDSNQLTNLDISKNLLLETLECQNNKITDLDVSKNTKLSRLDCSDNQLTSIDVSKNLSLGYFEINHNQLTTLNVSKNTGLKTLIFTNNNIADIDVSNNIALTDLETSSNQLTTLDVSKNPDLKMFYCNNNLLTSLDVSKNSALINFYCQNNQLTELNLKNGKNTTIAFLNVKSNSGLSCINVDNMAYSNANWPSYKDSFTSYSNNCKAALANTAPVIKAQGDQLYCPLSTINIVTGISITHDPAETGTQAGYIQISSGYSSGLDKLQLANPALHPNIITSWDATSGKLKLYSPAGTDILYSDLEAAIKDVTFTNSSATASGMRTFSITIGQANYLPSTGHFYLFVPSIGITWTQAKAAAEASTYYGLQGYLATLLAPDEAKLSGEQASGSGWIGGSDEETEGLWKWVTGPEAGTLMTYTFWNTGEPNNQGNEDYAHITQPGVGIKGSWNDLSNTGSLINGDAYQPKGYIVEYGGMPGELPLEIATSTKITIPEITSTIPGKTCDSGSITLTATANAGTISWYDAAVGGNLLTTGNTYTTPVINTTTTYYADAGCGLNRKPVVATVYETPAQPTTKSPVTNCGPGILTLEAASNIGEINWFTTSTGGTSLYKGTNFTTPQITANTTYYAEASNNGCINTNRTPVDITIFTPPAVADEEVILCETQKIILDAKITGMSYLWSTGEMTQTIEVDKGGIYTVEVTSPDPEKCTSKKTITVNEHKLPEIKSIDINDRTVVIHLTKEEIYYEYSVDGINFQDSNQFLDVPGGLQTAYVREKNGCGETNQSFVVIIVPQFFTPNNDGFNDTWEVTGMENYPEAQVTIYDRYGKFIAQLNISKMTWDGTLNKTPLPASDYWYSVKIDNIKPILKGHFSLKR